MAIYNKNNEQLEYSIDYRSISKTYHCFINIGEERIVFEFDKNPEEAELQKVLDQRLTSMEYSASQELADSQKELEDINNQLLYLTERKTALEVDISGLSKIVEPAEEM